MSRLHRSMQESDRVSKVDKETLSQQMEELARLQNTVGDREAEASALQKEVGKLKVRRVSLRVLCSVRHRVATKGTRCRRSWVRKRHCEQSRDHVMVKSDFSIWRRNQE